MRRLLLLAVASLFVTVPLSALAAPSTGVVGPQPDAPLCGGGAPAVSTNCDHIHLTRNGTPGRYHCDVFVRVLSDPTGPAHLAGACIHP